MPVNKRVFSGLEHRFTSKMFISALFVPFDKYIVVSLAEMTELYTEKIKRCGH